MKKYYYKTIGDIGLLEECRYNNNVKIGSTACRICRHNIDSGKKWIKCSKMKKAEKADKWRDITEKPKDGQHVLIMAHSEACEGVYIRDAYYKIDTDSYVLSTNLELKIHNPIKWRPIVKLPKQI